MNIELRTLKANAAYERSCRITRIEIPHGYRGSDDEGALRILGGSDIALSTLKDEGFKVSPINKK